MMNMTRMMNIPVAICAFLMIALIGCSDGTTGPLNSADNPFGVNATVATSDPIAANEAAEVRTNAQRNANDTVAVQADQVIRIATQEIPGAEVLEIRLDYDRDTLNYECVVRSGGKVYVIVISPKDGKVKEKKEIKEFYYTGTLVIDVNVVPVRQACDRAREIVDGDVVEANLEQVEGETVYIIIILTRENRYVTFYIDAKTGKEKKLKNENRCRGNNDSSMVDTANSGTDTVRANCDDDDRHKNKRGRGHYRHGKGHGYGHYYHCHCNCDCDDDGNGGGTDSLQVITKDSAKVVVQSMFDDSATVGMPTLNEVDDSTAFYETVVEKGDNRYEVTLNARTGAFVEVTQTRGDFENGEFEGPTVDGKTLVNFSVARTAALAQLAGTIQTWTLAHNKTENKWVYTFKIQDSATNTVKTVRVNAETGLFIDITG